LKLNGTHQLLVYADDAGQKSTYYKKNKEALVVTSKETGLDINAEKTKYRTKSQYKDL
jgi:hypothetical protein